MHYKNNKDLYQILGIEKSASQDQINSLALTKSSKDDFEVGKALMVLSEPTKRKEYDAVGWQPKWDNEFDEWLAACNTTFNAIHSHMGYGQKEIYHPDGEVIWIGGWELNPSLWAPMNSKSADANWIEKIYSIQGANWRTRMEDYKNRMITDINRVRKEKQATPYCQANWNHVTSGNCAKCGKGAKIRDARGEDKNAYCSQKCYFDNWESRYKIPKYEHETLKPWKPEEQKPKLEKYICVKCRYEGYDCHKMKNGDYYCKEHFNKYLEELKNPDKSFPNDNKQSPDVPRLSDKIKQLEKDIENYKRKKRDVPKNEKQFVQKIIDELTVKLKYERAKVWFRGKGGSKESQIVISKNRFTGQTTTKTVEYNPIVELLKWMKKEGIVNISLNASGNLVVEYSGSRAQVINNNNLTDRQKEVKSFFQQIKERGGQTYLNAKELENFVSQETNQTENNNSNTKNNDWVMPVVIGMGAVILVLISFIIYKQKKKGY